jgi:hypothetical protein
MHNLKMPKIGLTFSRALMPQLGPVNDYLNNLKKHHIKFEKTAVDPMTLKSSQSEFSMESVAAIMKKPRTTESKIIISNDGYVLDGHHRWIAHFNQTKKKMPVIKVDLPILELMRISKSFDNTKYRNLEQLKESIRGVIKESITNKYYK